MQSYSGSKGGEHSFLPAALQRVIWQPRLASGIEKIVLARVKIVGGKGERSVAGITHRGFALR